MAETGLSHGVASNEWIACYKHGGQVYMDGAKHERTGALVLGFFVSLFAVISGVCA
jgi:hypothetical protein